MNQLFGLQHRREPHPLIFQKALRKEVKAIGKENKKLEENGKNY